MKLISTALWIVDFPMFEWDEQHDRWSSMHHPFTSPNPDDMILLDENPGECRATAYDLVINGIESINLHFFINHLKKI